jgi:hypothetical protein
MTGNLSGLSAGAMQSGCNRRNLGSTPIHAKAARRGTQNVARLATSCASKREFSWLPETAASG